VIGNPFGRAPLTEPDVAELRDAVHEDADGRLPHDQRRGNDVYHHQATPEPTPDPVGAMSDAVPSVRRQPSRSESQRRRQVVLDRLAQGKANTTELAQVLGLSQDNALYLLSRMRKLGLIAQVGTKRPAVYKLAPKPATEPPPIELPAQIEQRPVTLIAGKPKDGAGPIEPEPTLLADRYLRFLANKRPERLLVLLESGHVEATDELLEYVDATVLGLIAA
jgi:hypothetical protein